MILRATQLAGARCMVVLQQKVLIHQLSLHPPQSQKVPCFGLLLTKPISGGWFAFVGNYDLYLFEFLFGGQGLVLSKERRQHR